MHGVTNHSAITHRRWFRVYRPVPTARVRLVCLPHAGGAASFYRNWASCFSTSVEVVAVQPPGREERIAEPMRATMEGLVEALADAMPHVADRPYILFGHSMGAAVAHELCLTLRRRGRQLPVHLVVSGREAPSRHRGGSLHCGGDAQLRDELKRLNGTATELMDSPDWCAMALPIIRNDYRLIETYRPGATDPLAIPITALAGEQDGELLPGDAEAWAQQTLAGFTMHRFPGDHFYLTSQRAGVVQMLQGLLDAVAPRAPALLSMP